MANGDSAERLIEVDDGRLSTQLFVATVQTITFVIETRETFFN